MVTTMAQRPATQLETELKEWLAVDSDVESAVIPIGTVAKWYKLAKKINASMRLDGSKAGKRKPKKKV